VVEEPRVSVFLKDGRVIGLGGKQGKIFLGDRDLHRVELTGSIDVQLGDYALHADAASYERDRDVILVPGEVQIRGEEFSLRGTGMEIHVASQRLTMAGGVETVLRPDA
jgi:lipopolysaccharide assembly outer membrane protein LptD (OstA)